MFKVKIENIQLDTYISRSIVYTFEEHSVGLFLVIIALSLLSGSSSITENLLSIQGEFLFLSDPPAPL